VNEVRADKQLRTTVSECAEAVAIPDFLKKAFSHDCESGGCCGRTAGQWVEFPKMSKPHLTIEAKNRQLRSQFTTDQKIRPRPLQ
jgi:hypothetical protein